MAEPTPDFYSLLLQVPLIAAFIWFVLTWSDRNQKALDKRDVALQDFIKQLRAEDKELRAQDRAVLECLVDQIEKLGLTRVSGRRTTHE